MPRRRGTPTHVLPARRRLPGGIRGRAVLGIAAAGLALTACSSGSNNVTPPLSSTSTTAAGSTTTTTTSAPTTTTARATTTSAPTTTTTPATTTTSAPATTTSVAPVHPTVTVTPSSGLTSGQSVRVHGAGFSPGASLVVIECADKGSATGPGDCNLNGLVLATSDARGQIDTDLTVLRGPFGSNRVTCSATHACLVSVSPPSASPTEQANASIQFR